MVFRKIGGERYLLALLMALNIVFQVRSVVLRLRLTRHYATYRKEVLLMVSHILWHLKTIISGLCVMTVKGFTIMT